MQARLVPLSGSARTRRTNRQRVVERIYLAVAALNQGPVVTPVATTTLLSTTARNNTLGSNCGTCSSAVKSAARVAGPS
jgi:hypothetical protein